ncbi:MAG: hypothetical protein JO213_20585 [Alphaproteobacteria bacterium]|nr:hypothetical protein [Alphaproteobacteria bacterium]
MASIPGTHYDVFSGNQAVNFGGPISGDFNVEVITNGSGTGNFALAPGFQALTVVNVNGNVMTALHGDFAVVDNGTNDQILLGDGNTSVGGGVGDTLFGGTGGAQFLDAHTGNQDVVLGSAGNATVFSGGGDTISGGSGGNATIGGVAGDTINLSGSTGNGFAFVDGHLGNQLIVGGNSGSNLIWGGAGDTIAGGGAAAETIGGVAGDTITGGTGNEFIDGSLGGQSITGGSAGNETIWGGPGDTINGGTGANVTIGGAAGDTLTGGSGNAFLDADHGNQSVVGGSGNSTIWGASGDTIQGASGSGQAQIGFGATHTSETLWDDGTATGQDTVSDFHTATDHISLAAGENVTSSQVVGGNSVQITLSNGSTITFVGTTDVGGILGTVTHH